MTQEKAIQEAKDRVAKKFKYRDWSHLIKVVEEHIDEYQEIETNILNAHIDACMIEYASSSSEKGDGAIGDKKSDCCHAPVYTNNPPYTCTKCKTRCDIATPKEHSEGETWESIAELFNRFKKQSSLWDFFTWVSRNYNPPIKK